MKKSLITLAVLAASGVASAQSSVTLYGLADIYFGSSKVTNQPRQTVVNGSGFNTSRFGLKGSEDLGGGLKANFVLESGFDQSTGAAGSYTNPYTGATSTSVFSRQSWVGFSGGFGEVKLGKMWTPFDDVKGSGAAGFDANIFAPAANVWLSNNYNDRPGNSIYYSTPSLGGFSAAGLYSLGENKTATQKAGKIYGFNVAYAGGPFAAAVSYQGEQAIGGATTTKYTQVNTSYDLGVAKILAAYGNVKTGPAKANEYQLGVDVPLGAAFSMSGGFAQSKDNAAGGNAKRTGFGLAGKYELSKRTFVYAGLNTAKSKASGVPDVKTNLYAVGVQHRF